MQRRAHEPLYHQLKRALLEQVDQDGLLPGDRFPSEAEIEAKYRVSRSTVRQAVQHLVLEGRLQRIQGKGTFLADVGLIHTTFLTSFTENMQEQGHEPSREVLEVETQPMPPRVARELGLAEGSDRLDALYLLRVLLVDGQPVGLAETWLPLSTLGERVDVLTRENLTDSSLYALLRTEVGLELRDGRETVYVLAADSRISAALNCAHGAPMLAVDRTTFGREGEPVEFTHLTFDGARYRYRSSLDDRPQDANRS